MNYESFKVCIEKCNQCAAACTHCSTACLHEPDIQDMAHCIELDMYCAEICKATAAFMAMGGNYAIKLCALCAEICEACATECAKHKHQHCQHCAEACHDCAKECRRMAA